MVATLGRSTLFLGHAPFGWHTPGTGLYLLTKQFYSVGVLSLTIIVVSDLSTGMALILQDYSILTSYGSEQAVGQMVALTLLRELGPVTTGPLFVGRVDSTSTAEIGNMKATRRLSSLEMIGIDPLEHIVVPHLWAGFVSMPLLAAIFSVVGIQGEATVTVDWLGVYEESLQTNMQNSVQFTEDVLNGVTRSIVFVFMVTRITVYQDYDCEPTSEGISRTTTRTMVYASLAALGFNFILAALTFGDF